LYATSVDYDPHAAESQPFFKIVQNKIHFAAHGHTAAEIIATRANADLPFMGLTVFESEKPVKSEIGIAYVHERLGCRTRRFCQTLRQRHFERQRRSQPKAALQKAEAEHEKHRKKTASELSQAERDFLESIKST
jgi:hypothetical protein